jgi:hypothetical protein
MERLYIVLSMTPLNHSCWLQYSNSMMTRDPGKPLTRPGKVDQISLTLGCLHPLPAHHPAPITLAQWHLLDQKTKVCRHVSASPEKNKRAVKTQKSNREKEKDSKTP